MKSGELENVVSNEEGCSFMSWKEIALTPSSVIRGNFKLKKGANREKRQS